MKTLKPYLLTIIIILTGISISYSQNDSNSYIYPDDISIEYESGLISVLNPEGTKITLQPFFQSVDNINKLRISNDSIMTVSGYGISNVQININKINKVSIRGGSHVWTGVGLGVLAGLGIGAAIGAANDPPGMFHGIATAFGGIVGTISGALIGGIIGSQITGYEDYELNQKNNKRAELERILKIDKKLNVNNLSY